MKINSISTFGSTSALFAVVFAVLLGSALLPNTVRADGPPEPTWYSDGPSYSTYQPSNSWYSDGASYSGYSPTTGWYSDGASYSDYNSSSGSGWYTDGASYSGYSPTTGWYSDGPSYSDYQPSTGWYTDGASYSGYSYDSGCGYGCSNDLWTPQPYTYNDAYVPTSYSYDTPTSYSYDTPTSYSYTTYNGNCGYYYNCNPPTYYTCADFGQIGTYPNCRTQPPQYCPEDTYGTYPNCHPIVRHCPEGQTGTYPNCHRPPAEPDPVCAISASDTSIDEGDSTTLRWTSENATSASISSIGSVSTGGSRSVSPSSDKTYTLTVQNDDGDEDTCSVSINVEEDNNDDDSPSCDLSVSDSRVEEGDRITLSWDTSGNATYASINEGIGRVDEDGGSKRITIDENTTFRMTVRDDDGDEDTCTASVRVDESNDLSSVTFYGDSVQNPPTVYLSSLPYTGLEDITPEMMAYWLLLITGAGALGYFFFTQNPSLFAFATGGKVREVVTEVEETEVVSNTASFVSALRDGASTTAMEYLRSAVVKGADVEDFLTEARATVADDDSIASRLDDAISASMLTGIRGAKEVLSA